MTFLLTVRSVLLWWVAIAVVTGVVWAIACTPGRAEERAIEAREDDRAARFAALRARSATRHPSSQPPDGAA